MTLEEFSNEFDTLVSSYQRFKDFDDKENLDSIEFDEYEKSVFLTKAQELTIVNLYNGKNVYGDSFESTEEIRRYLDSLVKTKVYKASDAIEGTPLTDTSKFFVLPNDIGFITLEQISYSDESLGCANNSRADIYPVTHDQFSRVRNNPFRGPTKYKALRVDYGDNVVEIIPKYTLGTYLIKYVSKPSPIILENLPNGLSIEGVSTATECTLNPLLHRTILERAVTLALSTKRAASSKEDK